MESPSSKKDCQSIMFNGTFENIRFSELKVQNYSHHLYEKERSLITNSTLKRIKEFSTGRYGIMQLLMSYGINNFPIERDQKGMPIFPNGIVGSISHSDKKCLVAMSTIKEYKSIGVDIEEYSNFDLSLCKYFLLKEEMELINNQADVYKQIMATVLFSAKEAFFKMQYVISKSNLDFLDIQINYIKPDSLQFRLLCDIGVDTERIKAYYSFDIDHVYTMVLNEN